MALGMKPGRLGRLVILETAMMGMLGLVLGAIAGAFGVKGEVRLKSFFAEPEDIAAYSPLSLEDGRLRPA